LCFEAGCQPKGSGGRTRLDQQPPFQKLDVLAVTKSIIGKVPPVENTPVVLICDGKN